MNEIILLATSSQITESQATAIAGFIIIFHAIISVIISIVIATDVSRITKVQTQPFQNKKPDYPDKVVELLQAIVSAEQHNTNEITALRSEMEKQRNGGTVPGMKSKDTANQEQIIILLKQQNEILNKILECSNGEEKKKLMEKWKQAQEIMNDM